MQRRQWWIALLIISALIAFLFILKSNRTTPPSSPGPAPQVRILLFGNHPLLGSVAENVQIGVNSSLPSPAAVKIKDANFDKTVAVALARDAFAAKPAAIVALGTPMIIACLQNRENDVPLYFGATNDPVALGLCSSRDPHDWVKKDAFQVPPGTKGLVSNFNYDGIAALAATALRHAGTSQDTSLGVILNNEEPNARSAADLLEKALSSQHITISRIGVLRAEECGPAARNLLTQGTHLIQIGPDNVAAAGITSILEVVRDKHVPVVAFDRASVVAGACGAVGLDFAKLGQQLGRMIATDLQSTANSDPAAPIVPFSESTAFLNRSAINAAFPERQAEQFINEAKSLGVPLEFVDK